MGIRRNKRRLLTQWSTRKERRWEHTGLTGHAFRRLESRAGQARLNKLYVLAKGYFDAEASASKWMLSPNAKLTGRSPMYVGVTRKGYRRVKELLLQMRK